MFYKFKNNKNLQNLIMRTISNRLKSIYYDSDIVDNLCKILPNSELVANLRCGIWYCKNQCVNTCYFKSTDGHKNQWDFNLRRLNINLLELAYKNNAVIVVDSTTNHRKVYPDALSKTLPIWVYIMNMYIDKLLNNGTTDIHNIKLPRFISENEKNGLMDCLDKKSEKWISELMKNIDETTTKKIVNLVLSSGNKRLVPMFVSSLDLFDEKYYQNILDNNFIPIICLSVGNHDSIFMENQIDRQFQYILGAGDDEEMWSSGLTSKIFWKNPELFLNCDDDDMIKNIIKKSLYNETNIKNVNVLSILNNTVVFTEQTTEDARPRNMLSIKVFTSVANFTKNIDIYNLKTNNCLFNILDKTNTLISKLYQYNITQIQFICNNFRVSLAVLVSIMVNFRDILFNSDLSLCENQSITKQYIRKIISYIYQFTGPYQMPRDFCKQLNKYYIEIL